ncbi:hypothetical protein MJT46_010793 [Ovis ammon polii x Ovis aries]|nr:hypothetical protein MJT46_010793 [Ovis ammon polii x Ovis aries]
MSDPRSTSLEMRRQTAKNREPGEGHSRQVRTQRPSSLYRRSPGQGPFQGRGQTPLSARSDLPRATWVQALICTVNRMKEQVKRMLSLSQSLQTARSQTRKVHRLHLCQVSPGAAQEEMTGGAGISLTLEVWRDWLSDNIRFTCSFIPLTVQMRACTQVAQGRSDLAERQETVGSAHGLGRDPAQGT